MSERMVGKDTDLEIMVDGKWVKASEVQELPVPPEVQEQ